MNTQEIGQFLGYVALHDNRKVGPGDVMAWEDVLPAEITLADARIALRAHRRAGSEWLMPSHIIAAVMGIRRQRLTDAGDPPMPGDLTYDQEKAWRRLWCGHVKDGLDRKAAATAASLDMNLTPEIERPPVERLAEIAAWGQRRSIPGRQSYCSEKHPDQQLLCGLPPRHKASEHYAQGVSWLAAS